MLFQPYPFERLNTLLKDINPQNPNITKLTIGEPQFDTPKIITKALKDFAEQLRYYPPSGGESYLKKAILDFIVNRYDLRLDESYIIPTFGTREVLFNLPQFYFSAISVPVIAHPNPFYQIYEGAAIASGAKTIYMNLTSENEFKPFLSKEEMKITNLVILNSPNNPTGVALSLDELKIWVQNALEFDFLLVCDECYSEIYESSPPPSVLEASYALGNAEFKNVIAINSISKRSSAPGLRSGFVAGDREFLKRYATYRTYAGLAIPFPLQQASAVAWRDKSECEKIRQIYAKNLKLARELFPQSNIAPYSFYLWLFVRDGEDFCKKLYEQEGILVLPGGFLGREGVGKEFVRIALVYETQYLREILLVVKRFYEKYMQEHSAISQIPPLSKAKIHFIGIGGIGISGLAKYLKAQGAIISGSDIAHSPTTHYLRSLGVEITIPHSKDAITNQDIIIHSTIIKPDNIEIIQAKSKNIPVFSRTQALKLILDSKRVYSVCGAHGKSTISAMLSSIFSDFGAIIGAESKEFYSNVREVQSQNIVFEADESDRSFLNSNPYFAIVPNAELEHMEAYNHNLEDFYGAYREFLKLAKKRCVNDDDEFLRDLDLDCIRLNPKKDIKNISYFIKNDEPYTRFELRDLGEFEVWGIGSHTASNASMAILCALDSMDVESIRENLKNYCGIKKRFDILSKSLLTIIDDYGHHPTEIKVTLNALKIYADLRKIDKITIIWQPHKYSRLFDNLKAFQECFLDSGRLIILPVWRAGEKSQEVDFNALFGHYKPTLASRIQRSGNVLEIYKDERLIEVLKDGIAIGFGAGDITYQLRGVK